MLSSLAKYSLLRGSNLRSVVLINKKNVTVEAKISALGLELPTPAVPKGNFINFTVVGNLAYLSGHLPQVNCTDFNF